jgi:hypothetical protein
MCNQAQRETCHHLFFNYDFALKCSRKVGIVWDLSQGYLDMFEQAKQNYSGPSFYEVATTALWGIWKSLRKFSHQCMLGGWFLRKIYL